MSELDCILSVDVSTLTSPRLRFRWSFVGGITVLVISHDWVQNVLMIP